MGKRVSSLCHSDICNSMPSFVSVNLPNVVAENNNENNHVMSKNTSHTNILTNHTLSTFSTNNTTNNDNKSVNINTATSQKSHSNKIISNNNQLLDNMPLNNNKNKLSFLESKN